MTADETRAVETLRHSGLGYKKIATIIGINVNTVKAYCSRHKISPEPSLSAEGSSFCRQCGQPITSILKCKPRKFCSEACRLKWWARHSDLVNRKAYYSFVCAACGKPFTSYGNSHRKYCSIECAAAVRRTRKSYSLICEMCGIEFESIRPKQRFCSQSCSQAEKRGEPLKYAKAKNQQAAFQGCEKERSCSGRASYDKEHVCVGSDGARLSDLPTPCKCAECTWFDHGERRCKGASNPSSAL